MTSCLGRRIRKTDVCILFMIYFKTQMLIYTLLTYSTISLATHHDQFTMADLLEKHHMCERNNHLFAAHYIILSALHKREMRNILCEIHMSVRLQWKGKYFSLSLHCRKTIAKWMLCLINRNCKSKINIEKYMWNESNLIPLIRL